MHLSNLCDLYHDITDMKYAPFCKRKGTPPRHTAKQQRKRPHQKDAKESKRNPSTTTPQQALLHCLVYLVTTLPSTTTQKHSCPPTCATLTLINEKANSYKVKEQTYSKANANHT
ncbi:hypothetical protein, unlikely [Trypanosoma brucei gambiense DAL972]|uniref:Uncharacterized protein n=1 Tax=Trypanosoma brucei gambiense (strain MHOM/CI/86/DAL972) TaxID=679716 RepID=C9ZTF0_TRYB9|nr:hypothetical protein, unlikely [Trypanosoma brucei gambiense DAL972]CBH12685.1 hypothetical protein, unlikely [Trypanosoma brucei gambiense DAL972]|eukprot:XP_011774965.1 hypothetical protein, unlikely [Trypanosoma brucei gambiense DAL972]